MSKEKETDAATALSQMSQSVPFHLTTGLSSPDPDPILETDSIGATCTLQPSSLDADMLFPLQDEQLSDRNVRSDPYISFDDADHLYAVNSMEHMVERHRFTKQSATTYISSFDGTEHPYASKLIGHDGLTRSKAKPNHLSSLHVTTTGRRSHSCEQCNKSFTTKSDLKRHMKVHLKNQLDVLSCDLCSATFRDQATKTRHLKIHNKSKNFQCKKCQKEFSRCDSYKNHLSIHAANKRYKCNICYSEFNYKSSFNRHVSAHRTDSLFICDICGKAFHRQDYVDSHKRKVHRHTCDRSTVQILQNLNTGANKTNKETLKADELVGNTILKPKSSHLESGEAILTSMAEQAANSNSKKPRLNLSEELSSGNLIHDNMSIPFSSPQIDQEFISYLDDTSDDVSECVSIPAESLKISIDHALSPGQS